MNARYVWLGIGLLVASLGVLLTNVTLAGQAATTPLTPGYVVHHAYTLHSPNTIAVTEPADPYHAPRATYAPSHTTVDQWTLIEPGGQPGAMLSTTRDIQGNIVQISSQNASGQPEVAWHPALGRLTRLPPTPRRFIDWDAADLEAAQRDGFRQTAQVMVAGQAARVFERGQRDLSNGLLYHHQFLVGSTPAGVKLGERISRVDANGTTTLQYEMTTQVFEIVARGAAPHELGAWRPPAAVRVVEATGGRPPVERAPERTEPEVARVVAHRVFKPGPAWNSLSGVFRAMPAPADTPNSDDGSWGDAVRAGDAVMAIYQEAGSNRLVEVVSGPRDALITRLKRSEAEWDAASPVDVTVAGRQIAGWMVTFASGESPSRRAILVDLTDTFLIVRFQGFDESAAIAFMNQLSVV